MTSWDHPSIYALYILEVINEMLQIQAPAKRDLQGGAGSNNSMKCKTVLIDILFQSRNQLYNHKSPSVSQSAKPLNSLKSSSIIHCSSFFIHPSFISRLLSFSACCFKSAKVGGCIISCFQVHPSL